MHDLEDLTKITDHVDTKRSSGHRFAISRRPITCMLYYNWRTQIIA